MKRIWAPWRLEFVTGEKKDVCIFCSKPKERDDRKNRIFVRGEYGFGMLNAFPYNPGHIMIAPYRHITEVGGMEESEWLDIFKLLKDSIAAIEGLMRPQGFNIGFNIGAASGGGFAHIHLHAVPRWRGDTNFLPVLAETKVLPEHLDATYDRIVKAMKRKREEKGKPE